MNLLRIPSDQLVLIDANIFIYANQQSSVQCVKLLERCANNEVIGVLTTHILAEVMHVLLLGEAKDLGMIKAGNPAKQLSEKPQLVKALNRYESLVRDLLTFGLQLEPLQREDFITAISIQRQYGLMTNDALFMAVATRLRINAIASADRVFSNVQGIIHYSPDDLND